MFSQNVARGYAREGNEYMHDHRISRIPAKNFIFATWTSLLVYIKIFCIFSLGGFLKLRFFAFYREKYLKICFLQPQ